MHFFIFRCQYHFFNAIVRTLNPGELNLEFCLLLVRTSDALDFILHQVKTNNKEEIMSICLHLFMFKV